MIPEFPLRQGVEAGRQDHFRAVAAVVALHLLPDDMALGPTSIGQALGPRPDHRKAHSPHEAVAAGTAADPVILSRPGRCPGHHPPGSVAGEAAAKISADAGAGAGATMVMVVVADRQAVGMVTDERLTAVREMDLYFVTRRWWKGPKVQEGMPQKGLLQLLRKHRMKLS